MDRKVLEVSSLSLSFSDYLPTYLCIIMYIYLSIYLSIYPSIYLSTYLPVLSASLKTEQFSETPSIFELDNVKNEAILRDFLSF